MPQLIDTKAPQSLTLDEAAEAIEAVQIDPRDEAGFATLAPILAGLGANRQFLADIAIEELKTRHVRQRANVYGAQALLLRPTGGRYLLRAAFWPAAADAILRSSGGATFCYGLAHDHNFPFLTYGYFGPGYWSDYYEREARGGAPGDDAGLTFTGRKRLEPGQLLYYRAHRDIHRQLPPDGFSVTINIIGHDPAQPWRDQLRYDLEANRIDGCLSTTPSEALVALAVHLGGGNGVDLAHHLADRHPHPRMRQTARAAIASRALAE